MGATSSIISRQNDEPLEECKDERSFDFSRIYYNGDNKTNNSSVWLAIDAILKTVHIIQKDFRFLRNNELLLDIMNKIIINVDSIYDIQKNDFKYTRIQSVYEEDIVHVKKTLQDYYGTSKLVVIKLKKNQSVEDLGLFMYDIFNFQVVEKETEKNVILKKYLYVYV